MNLRPSRTLAVFGWGMIDNLAGTGINFVVGLILARFLGPEVYGTIGVALIFVALSNVLIDGGFSNALIRSREVHERDYNTVFVINVSAGVGIYVLSFFLAPFIAQFFDSTVLTAVIRTICLSIVIGSFAITPKVWLTRHLNFKRQAIASIVSSSIGAITGISLVFADFGIWALVAQQLVRQALYTAILLYVVPFKPHFRYSSAAAKELFSYGSRILMSGIVDSLYNNLYLFVIGKVFSPRQLGLYSRAEQFSSLLSVNFSMVLQRTTLPLLTQHLKSSAESLERFYQGLMQKVTLFSALGILGICAIADHLIIAVLGQQWNESVIYLRILCFTAVFQPMIMINQNILQVFGHAKLFLRIEIFKKVLSVIVIATTVSWGMLPLLWGMMGIALLSFLINGYFAAQQLVNTSFARQLFHFMLCSIIAALPALAAYGLGKILVQPHHLILGAQLFLLTCAALLLYFVLRKTKLLSSPLPSLSHPHEAE